MDVKRAIEYVGNLVLQPGWKVSAVDHTNRFQDTILVRVDYHCANSNRDQARAGYPEMIDTYASFALPVGNCTETELYFRVIMALVQIHIHETREFTRIGGTYDAPFHPHRLEGMSNWETLVKSVDLFAGVNDLQFGIA